MILMSTTCISLNIYLILELTVMLRDTKVKNNINSTEYESNTTFGEINPLIVGVDICFKLISNILSLNNAVIFKKYLNSLIIYLFCK